jgi:HEPN domain-containing protein
MRPPEEVLGELIGQWLAKAEMDLLAAELLLKEAEPLNEVAAFHCQQAAEKSLEALLTSRQLEFSKTHDLGELLDLISRVLPELARELDGIEILTPFGVAVRYPGSFPEILPGQAEEFLDLARRTRNAVRACLGNL